MQWNPETWDDNPPSKLILQESGYSGWFYYASTGWANNPSISWKPALCSGSANIPGGEYSQSYTTANGVAYPYGGSSIITPSPKYREVDSSSGSVEYSVSLGASGNFQPQPGLTHIGYLNAGVQYSVSIHAHPYDFRLKPDTLEEPNPYNLGEGQMSFWYLWKSTDGNLPSLSYVEVDENVLYPGDNPYWYPNPPFLFWSVRNPTEGHTANPPRTTPGDLGWTFDKHLRGGEFIRFPGYKDITESVAIQYFQFHCNQCMKPEEWQRIEGPNAGLHTISRRFEPAVTNLPKESKSDVPLNIWRYSVRKHGRTAWLTMDLTSFVADGMD